MSENTNSNNLTVGGISFSPEEIELMRQGGNVSGAAGGAPVVLSASQAVDITEPAGKGLRPQIGGHEAGKEKISRPSSRLAQRLDDTKDRAQAAKELKAQHEVAAALQPESLRRDLEALRRQVKRLEKQLKEGTDAKA